jgi:hypothetical protein
VAILRGPAGATRVGFADVRHYKIYRTPWLASNTPQRYVRRVKERLALRVVLCLIIASLLSACASSGDSMSSDSASQSATSGTPVPGETKSDEGKFTPGGPGASGSVHW